VKVRLLGTAAGGGLPQWNCACATCTAARPLPPGPPGTGRTQDCVAVSGDGHAWYLLNASPDLRTQIVATPELTPGPGRRETPLRGVLLSTAELDHTIGLLTLREAERLTVFATATVLAALDGPFPARRIVAGYTSLDCVTVTPGTAFTLDGGLEALAVRVGTKPPRYAAGLPGEDWVVAYRLSDRDTGGVLVYAPCLPAWGDAIDSVIGGADCVLLDGTFHHDDELARATGVARTATEMGHLPIAASLPHVQRHPGTRFVYTHLNNTNAVTVLNGATIGADGDTITL
jgi:pyrroloquinoline quinone biosynthesis protein B